MIVMERVTDKKLMLYVHVGTIQSPLIYRLPVYACGTGTL